MKLDYEKVLELLHMKIHSIQMLSNYNPNHFENEMYWVFCKHFGEEGCNNCKILSEGLSWELIASGSKKINKFIFKKRIRNLLPFKLGKKDAESEESA